MIIPTCDRPEVLAECLRSLAAQLWESEPLPPESLEIIVADDSTEESAQRSIVDLFPAVLFLPGPKRGPAANRNAGASKASGEVLVFVDDDCICSEHLIESYLRAALDNPDLNVFEGKTVAMGSPKSHADECPVNASGGYLWSCNFAIKKNLFESVNGFDEAFPYAAMEDVDLRHRLKTAGAKFLFVPNAEVSHPWVSRPGWERVRRHRLSYLIYLRKHPSELQEVTVLKLLASSAKIFLRETAKGVLRYGFKNVSQRLMGVVGDIYLLSMRPPLHSQGTKRPPKLTP